MAIHTPNGLKLRFDQGRLAEVLAPAAGKLDLTDAFMDVELWANFPNAVSVVVAIVTAWVSRSWLLTLIAAVVAYAAANLLQTLLYSRFLKVLFPQLLGGWIIALPLSGLVGYLLYSQDAVAVAAAQFIAVVANITHLSDLLLLPLTPLRAGMRRLLGIKVGDVEIAFIRILDIQAKRLNVELDWKSYGDRGV